MVLMNREYSETCKAILFADGRFDKLSVRRGSNVESYNDRRIQLNYEEGYICMHIYDKNGHLVEDLPQRYYYSNGSRLFEWYDK